MKFNRIFLLALLVSLSVLLSACGAAPATNWPGITASGEVIYLATGQYIYSVQAKNGSEVIATGTASPLRFPLKADGNISFYAPPVVTADGTLIVGNAAAAEHSLYALNLTDASTKWSFNAGKPWLAGGLLFDETVFVPAGDGKLYAFSQTGEKLWERTLSEHALWTTPVTDGTSIYISSIDHVIYSIDPSSGEIRWQKELDNGIIGAPAISDGVLYVGTLSGNLYAMKTADGSQVWVKTLEGNIWGTPGIDAEAGTLYIGTVYGTAGKFYALKTESGDVVWSKDDEGSIVAGPLVLKDQVVYVTELGHVQSLNKDSSANWNADFPKNKIYTPPMLAGDLIVVAPMGSEFLLVAYDTNGAQKWNFIPAK